MCWKIKISFQIYYISQDSNSPVTMLCLCKKAFPSARFFVRVSIQEFLIRAGTNPRRVHEAVPSHLCMWPHRSALLAPTRSQTTQPGGQTLDLSARSRFTSSHMLDWVYGLSSVQACVISQLCDRQPALNKQSVDPGDFISWFGFVKSSCDSGYAIGPMVNTWLSLDRESAGRTYTETGR